MRYTIDKSTTYVLYMQTIIELYDCVYVWNIGLLYETEF